jgi:spore coat protein JB
MNNARQMNGNFHFNQGNRGADLGGMNRTNPNMKRDCACLDNDAMQNGVSPVCDKNRVVREVYELGFVMTEMLLYLDTHPNDSEAIEYYNDCRQRYNDAVAAYESLIGPLTFNAVGADNYFNWAATPLPWEKGDC